MRPGKRSRPRTKIRPKHEDAVDGFVMAVDRGRYTCRVEDRDVTAMRARELGRRGVVVGDHVKLVGDLTGKKDTLARIVKVQPRRGQLRRYADDDATSAERILVANVDQLVVVSSLVDPPLRYGFIDRCLVAALDAGVQPVLSLTKCDLDSEGVAAVEAYYADLNPIIVTSRPEEPVDSVRDVLRDKVSVLIGHSGVGKSTLVNRLVPGADRTTAAVRTIGKGSHTSTSAVALELPAGGWVIDTPGVRSFGLAHVTADSLIEAFPELMEVAEDCPRGCVHTLEVGECALDEDIGPDDSRRGRLESYRRMLASVSAAETRY
ncbi:ribosome small subunit-dependent GTPase A [Natronoglycomyces albus]|uniref:ribosome small subunit-dependent GTPase A n=1 Tax=Natronoglycomyces albus TaxID=2811108 RepID=UPI001FECCCCE|nr:ribosome small subunit-dependent GTPase A [Natronoglycomyces albus]